MCIRAGLLFGHIDIGITLRLVVNNSEMLHVVNPLDKL